MPMSAPFPPHLDGLFQGQAPATLRVLRRPGDHVRFHIDRPERPPVMVDLRPDEVRALVAWLTSAAAQVATEEAS